MKIKNDVQEIIENLRHIGAIENQSEIHKQMDGTTEGLVYLIKVDESPKYVLKLDQPVALSLVEQYKKTYPDAPMLPKLTYTAPDKTYIVYTFLKGSTDYIVGSKEQWLKALVSGLIQHYISCSPSQKWGDWLDNPRNTWREFMEEKVDYARSYIGDRLPLEDHTLVKSLLKKATMSESQGKFLLHGDCGVHNFIFSHNELIGVIDPSPIIGPPLYDLLYAFCSSPDDLSIETLMPAFVMLNQSDEDQPRLIEEVIIQLYYRLGICLKHHPHDIDDYLQAWRYWKSLISNE
ncbi:hypothetical protein BK120_30580 [Paenibacillus sp. FSL A5-0031]|uniref:phosphotransferase n=1 Tax=Paenibacillus sp. FSL A5-0031 TaxID=1920420 RepID=UPI0009701345|nr:phosphotransferase [Paenibacillus sp. FSL A5-0031]OME75826.1 hypothetical protein BK120_30580 [Paenibacillus sp. FSL A5-0031]